MKKSIIISIIVILLLGGSILLLNNKKVKPNSEPINENKEEGVPVVDDNMSVNIFDGRAEKSLDIDGVQIDNIFVINEDGKQRIYFELKTETKDLNDYSLKVILVNPFEEEQITSKTLNLQNGDSKERKYNLDITDLYNNPKQLKFILE